jgi:catechol-2,3-dioxygenase
LYHVAILYPDRASLADALRRLIEHKVPLDGAADHGVSEALYLTDPDGNGLELYVDRDPAAWPRDAKGELAMTTGPLDLERAAGRITLTFIMKTITAAELKASRRQRHVDPCAAGGALRAAASAGRGERLRV